MHQIRLQAAFAGHPILGDAMYGSHIPFSVRCRSKKASDRQIALHGRELRFMQPDTRETISVVAPLPPSWSELNVPLE